MEDTGKLPSTHGGLKRMLSLQEKGGFPDEFRAFCDHELSVTMDSFGGINEVELIDCLERDGFLYPDQGVLPVFSKRRGVSLKRPLFGPAIQLFSRFPDGRTVPHYPEDPAMYPWGVDGENAEQSFSMLMDRRRILWRCTRKVSGSSEWYLSLSRRHLFRGEYFSFKNQRIGDHCEEQYKAAGLPCNKTEPFPNGPAKVEWSETGFHPGKNILLYRGEIQFPYGKKVYFFALSADVPLIPDELPFQRILKADWKSREFITAAMAFGDSEEEASAMALDAVHHYELIRKKKIEYGDQLEKEALSYEMEALPLAESFGKACAGYVDSMLVGNGCGTRAASNKFGFFAMWDTIYPIRDFLWNGRMEDAKRMLRHIAGYPWIESSPWVAAHVILEWDEVLAFDDDPLLEKELYPVMKKIFNFCLRLTESRFRLVLCGMNAGVDYPEELGLSGLFLSPCVNGFWYGACRVIRNHAARLGDEKTAEEAAEVIRRIECGFRQVFFAASPGYLRSGADRNLNPGPVEIYQNTSTLGYDYPYGMYLMRSLTSSLAAYQAGQLWHPKGHLSVPLDSPVPCEMWKTVHMNQHNGHEMKLQRLAGNVPEIHRVIGEYLKNFARWKVAQETFNYAGAEGNVFQTANWQTFSATAALEALRSGVAGIFRHRGGLWYCPAEDSGRVVLRNLPLRNRRITVEISGSGRYAEMSVNGRAFSGSMQLPCDLPIQSENPVWEIRRTSDETTLPFLLSATDLPIRNLRKEKQCVTFTAAGSASSPLCIAGAPGGILLTVNGTPVSCEWDPESSLAWIDRVWKEGDVIRFENKKTEKNSRPHKQ